MPDPASWIVLSTTPRSFFHLPDGSFSRMTVFSGFRFPATLVVWMFLLAGCHPSARPVRVFSAAGFAPVWEAIREDCRRDLGIDLLVESSGSEVACRKLAELGRPCDLLVLADGDLVARLLRGQCSWRIDFATDEVVLGIGARASGVSDAEKNWPDVLLRDGVSLSRANESLAPIGYRTLLVLALQERLGNPGLQERLKAKSPSPVDDVERLAVLLKTGETDYAFLYRSTCLTHSIRFITLDRRVNLGSPDEDYGRASVTFSRLKSGERKEVTVKGAPCTWTVTMPENCENKEAALATIRWLLGQKAELLAQFGYSPIAPPKFFGGREAWQATGGNTVYSGPLK